MEDVTKRGTSFREEDRQEAIFEMSFPILIKMLKTNA